MTGIEEERPSILVERRGALAVLILNRPHRANALNAGLLRELRTATIRIEQDPAVRVVIVTGAGRYFSSGADLREKSARRHAVFERHPHVLDLGRLPQPVIAAINGAALGGGCEIALSCDFRFMAADAVIGLPAIRFGALPGSATMVRLPGMVGLSWAKRLIMTGDPVDAEQAERIGLVDEVVEPDELLNAAEQFALRLTERADYALRTAKALLNRRLRQELDDASPIARDMVRAMATPQQHAAARAAAAKYIPAYGRIFGKHENGPGGSAAEHDAHAPGQ